MAGAIVAITAIMDAISRAEITLMIKGAHEVWNVEANLLAKKYCNLTVVKR